MSEYLCELRNRGREGIPYKEILGDNNFKDLLILLIFKLSSLIMSFGQRSKVFMTVNSHHNYFNLFQEDGIPPYWK